MKRPNKKDYDLNDHFNCVKYAIELGKYIDKLEQFEIKTELKLTTIEIKPHKFEVYPWDAELKLEHDSASKYCKGLGDGWRLPERNEQLEMYKHKQELGLEDAYYWSSTAGNSNLAWYCGFGYGYSYFNYLNGTCRVRAVRTIK
tara:strand:+ start:356 stop:787 length:432 start_codon:yes stop_codon:yes gene_type:complete